MRRDTLQFFKGKKITLIGLGLLGRGVGDAVFLAQCGAKVLVTDKKSVAELAPSVAKLKKFSNIRFALGGHSLKDFKNTDIVIKAAGVPLDSPYIQEARKNKTSVYMSTALFVKLLPPDVTVIGITGTRGKTTTAHLIYEILIRHTTYDIRYTKQSIFLGGNIQGISTLALLPKVRPGDFVVLELDSWQLQGFGDLKISPHIAVFTNFLPDHMNYYGGSMKKYFQDKANIFKNATRMTRMHPNDPNSKNTFIVGEQAMLFIKKYFLAEAKRAVMARAKDVPKNWKLKIRGEHNRANIACAVAVADTLGVPRSITKKAVENFHGVPGRLELVREVRGIKIYNDTTATTPEATIAALRALGMLHTADSKKRHSNILKNVRMSVQRSGGEKRSIILIMGGADKGLDMDALVKEIPKWCKAVVLLSGTGTERMKKDLGFKIYDLRKNKNIPKSYIVNHKSESWYEAQTLRGALMRAFEIAESYDMVLFSPAFASFGMFKNEYDRGEQFVKLVRSL